MFLDGVVAEDFVAAVVVHDVEVVGGWVVLFDCACEITVTLEVFGKGAVDEAVS